MSLDGFHEWAPEEYAEKESAMEAAPRRLMAVLQNAAGDDLQLFDADASDLANTSFEFAAINQILAWLNFPYKLRPYLDCLIGLAGSSETSEFTAVNIEIGRQIRTGKAIKDASITTWVTRQKKQFQEWQSLKQFNLVDIQDGKFDARNRKNTPTTYKLHIVEWAKLAVKNAQAKSYWRQDKHYRRHQLRAIRRAAFELLQSMPECGPLRLKIRSLSEEEKLDRRVHLQISAHLKNLDFVSKMDLSADELHAYVLRELNKAFEKKRGVVGNLITPAQDEPDVKSSVYHKLKTGTLLDEIPFDETEPEKTVAARFWSNGEWVESSNAMPEKSADSRTDIAADNVAVEENSGCNLLNPLSHGQTFLSESVEIEDAPAPAESSANFSEKLPVETYQEIVHNWFRFVAAKLPDAMPPALDSGVWQFHRFEAYTPEQEKAESILEQTILLCADGAANLSDLKTAFVDSAIHRVEYWQHKRKTGASPSAEFRARLEASLTLPEDFGDG